MHGMSKVKILIEIYGGVHNFFFNFKYFVLSPILTLPPAAATAPHPSLPELRQCMRTYIHTCYRLGFERATPIVTAAHPPQCTLSPSAAQNTCVIIPVAGVGSAGGSNRYVLWLQSRQGMRQSDYAWLSSSGLVALGSDNGSCEVPSAW